MLAMERAHTLITFVTTTERRRSTSEAPHTEETIVVATIAQAQTAEERVRPVAGDIRRMAAQAEAERRLPDELLSALKAAGLFSLYTPKEFGGLGLPLPDALRVVEEVSRHDGSVGWTVALGIANGLFTSGLPEASAAHVLGDGARLITGAPGFNVRAVQEAGGYRVTGRWHFNSGTPNADWISVSAVAFDGDTPRMGERGPEMVHCFIRPSEVQTIDTWHVTGLRATGTHDLYADGVFVPEEMTAGLVLPAGIVAVRECILARLPLFTVLGVAQAPPVCLGIARRAIDDYRESALAKELQSGARVSELVQAQVGLARAEALVRSARSYWYENLERIWEAAVESRPVSLEERTAMRLASLTAAENSVAAVDLLYRLGGTSSIYQSSPIERCWRDVHTAAQHLQVQDGRWETAGRVLFGMDPASPFI